MRSGEQRILNICFRNSLPCVYGPLEGSFPLLSRPWVMMAFMAFCPFRCPSPRASHVARLHPGPRVEGEGHRDLHQRGLPEQHWRVLRAEHQGQWGRLLRFVYLIKAAMEILSLWECFFLKAEWVAFLGWDGRGLFWIRPERPKRALLKVVFA